MALNEEDLIRLIAEAKEKRRKADAQERHQGNMVDKYEDDLRVLRNKKDRKKIGSCFVTMNEPNYVRYIKVKKHNKDGTFTGDLVEALINSQGDSSLEVSLNCVLLTTDLHTETSKELFEKLLSSTNALIKGALSQKI